jgi:polar amino acid transport system permease protein
MSETPSTNAAPAPAPPAPEPIRAIPIRHYGRWVGAAVSLGIAALIIRLFVVTPNVNWERVGYYLTFSDILAGLELTIILTIAAMVVGLVLGTVIAVMRLSANPVLRTLSWVYIWFFRGTPLLMQILFWFNIAIILPQLGIGIPFTDWGVSVDTNVVVTSFVAALIALGLNEAAYMSEIVRAGILVVDYGQTEAAVALGMSRALVFRMIVLPQAMRAIIPPTGNELIGLLKNTSLVSVIAAQELLTRAQNIYAQNLLVIELLFVAAFWYLLVTSLLMWGQYYVERYFAKGSTNRPLPPTPTQRLRAWLRRKLSSASASDRSTGLSAADGHQATAEEGVP